MKKIFFVLAISALAFVGCQKSASVLAPANASKSTSLTQDNAEAFYKSQTSRSKIYDVNGKYVKLSLIGVRDSEDPFQAEYSLGGLPLYNYEEIDEKAGTVDANDKQILSAYIKQLEGEFNQVSDINLAVADTLKFEDFKPFEPVAEKAAYILACFDAEKNPVLTFGVVVADTVCTKRLDPVVVDSDPVAGDITEDQPFETVVAKVFYGQYKNGAWL